MANVKFPTRLRYHVQFRLFTRQLVRIRWHSSFLHFAREGLRKGFQQGERTRGLLSYTHQTSYVKHFWRVQQFSMTTLFHLKVFFLPGCSAPARAKTVYGRRPLSLTLLVCPGKSLVGRRPKEIGSELLALSI